VQQGGVMVNEKKAEVTDAYDREDFSGEGMVIKKGKKIFHRAQI